MRRLTILIALICWLAGMPLSAGDDVKGLWHTDADKALAAAAKTKCPVLAVAMDHG